MLHKPMTVAKARAAMKDGRIKAVLLVDLSDLIDNDLEGLNDLCESRIVENGILGDIHYKVVGHSTPQDEGSGQVLIEVDAELDLPEEDEPDETPSYHSHEAHGTDRLTDFINEGGVVE